MVHLAATPAPVPANQASPTPMEDAPATALESPDPDTTSAAPALVTAAAAIAAIDVCRIYLFSCHFQPFLVIFFIMQKNARYYCIVM